MMWPDREKIPDQLDRFELKYLIPPEMVEPITDFSSLYCFPDRYSLAAADGYYRVNNLYLDTPGLLFLKNRLEGLDNRFNMRIRSYGCASEFPWFLEIKQKTGGVVRKYRSETRHAYLPFGEEGEAAREEFSGGELQFRNRRIFDRLVYAYQVQPKVLTQYDRLALISDVDTYARVTFDRNLRFKPENEYRMETQEDEMVCCDAAVKFDPGCSVILELKCYARHVPFWMIDLIRAFDLHRTGFSKYWTGLMDVIEQFHYDPAIRVSPVA